MNTTAIAKRLEQYTLKYPNEVLLVTAEIEGEEDVVIIYRGFSSSLMRATAFDPEVPVLPQNAQIAQIDRLAGPYTPDNPRYLERDISLDIMEQRLQAAGI